MCSNFLNNLFNSFLMSMVKMLLTDFVISHTIQNQLNSGQVIVLFYEQYAWACWWKYNEPKCVYEPILRIRPVEFLCPHTASRWEERWNGCKQHAKVDFNCNAIIMIHGFSESFPRPFSICSVRFFPRGSMFSICFLFCFVFPSVCLLATHIIGSWPVGQLVSLRYISLLNWFG